MFLTKVAASAIPPYRRSSQNGIQNYTLNIEITEHQFTDIEYRAD